MNENSPRQSKIVKHDFSVLDKFVKGLELNMVVQVGIFGAHTNRKDSKGNTNADVGAANEFGTSKIPKRSWLRDPIFQNSEQILKYVQTAGALRKLAAGKKIEVLADLGIACENAIERAFDSAGFGQWAPNASSTIRRKGSDSPLIDTKQLRFAVASAVVQA
jgi:hypothetical protein